MIELKPVHEENWTEAIRLKPAQAQRAFVASAEGILARAYAYRACDARALAIYHDGTMVGLMMVRDLDEEPACYELQQLLIDEKYQNKGYGSEALRQIIARLKAEGQYDCVEVCVKKENAAALHVYLKEGFRDTGYIDPAAPDCLNLTLRFA